MKCEECKKEFLATRKWQKFCGEKCRLKNWIYMNPRVPRKKEGL